jgi:hypothetical protein
MKAEAAATSASPVAAALVGHGSGELLPEALRRRLERLLGADLSAVRIHREPAAKALGVLAYTRSTDIYFAPDQYDLGTQRGRELLGHELMHVVQQAQGRVRPTGLRGGLEINDARDLEREADAFGQLVGVASPDTESATAPDAPTTATNVSPDRGAYNAQHGPALAGPGVTRVAQMQQHPDAQPEASPPGTRSLPLAQVLFGLVEQWRAAGLLDPPFRPANVAAFPAIRPPRTGTIRASDATPIAAGAASAARSAPTGPGQPVPNSPERPPLRLAPGPEPVPPGEPVPFIPPALLGLAVVVIVLLWSNEPAPAWMTCMNPITQAPYGSPDEFNWTFGLSAAQRDYLQQLMRARELSPDPSVDGDSDPFAVPEAAPRRRRRDPERCFAMQVPRRGGHRRHDAYATKVTSSPTDYYVSSGPGLSINYDGLQVGTVNVWEVKTGYGWFFNPASAGLTLLTLARWDAQKTAGLAVAARCGYTHLWAHPDRHIVQLLIARWGGTPPVLNIPE